MASKAKKGEYVAPLQELAQSVSQKPKDRHYVALSVAGNDFRVNLGNALKLLWDIL